MTLITFQDGRPFLNDGKIGSEGTCCCGACCYCNQLIQNPANSFGLSFGCDGEADANAAHNAAVAHLNAAAAAMLANGWLSAEVEILSVPGPSGRFPPEECEDIGLEGCECDIFTNGSGHVFGCCGQTGSDIIFFGSLAGGEFTVQNCLEGDLEFLCEDGVTQEYCTQVRDGIWKHGRECLTPESPTGLTCPQDDPGPDPDPDPGPDPEGCAGPCDTVFDCDAGCDCVDGTCVDEEPPP